VSVADDSYFFDGILDVSRIDHCDDHLVGRVARSPQTDSTATMEHDDFGSDIRTDVDLSRYSGRAQSRDIAEGS
jgi:hypothetical protein